MKLNNIKIELARAGITQGQLAKDLGANKSTVGNWANNLTQPSIEKLYKIANAIGCPAPRLLKEVNPLSKPATDES